MSSGSVDSLSKGRFSSSFNKRMTPTEIKGFSRQDVREDVTLKRRHNNYHPQTKRIRTDILPNDIVYLTPLPLRYTGNSDPILSTSEADSNSMRTNFGTP